MPNNFERHLGWAALVSLIAGVLLVALWLDMRMQDRVERLEHVVAVQQLVDSQSYVCLRSLGQNQHSIIQALRSELSPKEFTPFVEPLTLTVHDLVPNNGEER